MPRGDGSGPAGMGPMTGRGAGYCAGYPAPGFMNSAVPRMGMGWGFRGGRRAAGYAPYGVAAPMAPPAFAPGVQPGFGYGMTQEQEVDVLKNQAQMLGQQLEQINSRLEELEKVEE